MNLGQPCGWDAFISIQENTFIWKEAKFREERSRRSGLPLPCENPPWKHDRVTLNRIDPSCAFLFAGGGPFPIYFILHSPPVSSFSATLFRCVLFSCLPGRASVGAAEKVDYFTDNGYGKTVSTLQHPAAEYFKGVTYVAYQGPHEDPYVAAYHHGQGTWSGPVKAGVNPMGLSPDQVDPGALDNHGRPALTVDDQGFIHVIFGGHGGLFIHGENKFGLPGGGRQIHAVTEKHGDITSWKILDNVSPFGTYSQWVKSAHGGLYLFYRHGSHRSDWVYQKSTDNGRTFAPPVSFLKSKESRESPAVYDSWYAWFDPGQGDTITASYVYHPCGTSPAHNSHRQNTYYMLLNCQDSTWTNVKGEKLALPVTKEAADEHTLILATGSEKSNHGTCHVDSEGHPHVMFRFPGDGIRYFRWDGLAWQKPTTVADGQGGGQDGDFIIDSPMQIRMLLSQSGNGGGAIGWWDTLDGGLTWKRGKSLFSLPSCTFEPSTLVRNGLPEARMLVGGVDTQTHLYRKMYLIGDHGALGRPAADTRHLGDRLETIRLMPQTREKEEARKRKKAGLSE